MDTQNIRNDSASGVTQEETPIVDTYKNYAIYDKFNRVGKTRAQSQIDEVSDLEGMVNSMTYTQEPSSFGVTDPGLPSFGLPSSGESKSYGDFGVTGAVNSLTPYMEEINQQNNKYSQDRGAGCTDCSAFTENVFKKQGIEIGIWTGSQKTAGKGKAVNDSRAEDLVFFDTNDGRGLDVSHVGIDNGDGTFTHFSSKDGGGVRTTPFEGYYPVKIRRRVK